MTPALVTPALLRAAGASAADAARYAPHIAASCARRGVTSPSDVANLLAEIMNESGNLSCVHEVMNYTSASRLCSVFPSHFHSPAAALPYVRQPQKLGDLVYAKLGGYEDRGDGLAELTGAASFRLYAADLGLAVSQVEQYMTTPAGAADSAVWYFVHFGCRGIADPAAVRCRWAGAPAGSRPIGLANVLRLYAVLAQELGVKAAAPKATLPAPAWNARYAPDA